MIVLSGTPAGFIHSNSTHLSILFTNIKEKINQISILPMDEESKYHDRERRKNIWSRPQHDENMHSSVQRPWCILSKRNNPKLLHALLSKQQENGNLVVVVVVVAKSVHNSLIATQQFELKSSLAID